MKSPCLNLLAPMLVLILHAALCDTFSTHVITTRHASSTGRRAWSLDIPDGLGSFKSTWYNTVENPTARRKVYDDAPREYRFVTTGSDWPSLGDDDVSVRANLEKERFQINPFRRAANWILRRRRQ